VLRVISSFEVAFDSSMLAGVLFEHEFTLALVARSARNKME